MINIILWSLLNGFFRMIHGAGRASRLWLLVFTCLAGVTLYDLNMFVSLLFIGSIVLFWCSGWGKYFPVIGSTALPYNPNEKESYVVDYLIKGLPINWQPFIGMTLRFGLYALPIGILTLNPYILGTFLIGGMYWLHRFHKNWYITEYSTGFFATFCILAGSL